jgi:hypothetical protein
VAFATCFVRAATVTSEMARKAYRTIHGAGFLPSSNGETFGSGELCVLFLWVDDLIIIGTQQECDRVVADVLGTFKGRDLDEASWLLGMSVKRDMSAKIIELSQERMIGSALIGSLRHSEVKHFAYGS